MSCGGWEVGDSVRALKDYFFDKNQVIEGSPGVITKINKYDHIIEVQFDGLAIPIELSDDEIEEVIGVGRDKGSDAEMTATS